MRPDLRTFGERLKALRDAAGFTQDELATISGLSVHAISALERAERRRPHVDTVRAIAAALDLAPADRDALAASARGHTVANDLPEAPLPVPLTPLLGRENDLARLRQWSADPAARLITLLGPGGVGKTRLAVEMAHEVANGERHVAFASLASVRDPSDVALAIAEALGLPDVPAAELPKRVRATCQHTPLWLVVDNFEHVLSAAPVVSDLLAAAPSLRVLATSRAPLRIRGEREYRVEPLALAGDAEVLAPADLARVPAVHLFVDRIRDVVPDFRLTLANGNTIAAICRRLEALPLALELAAPWVKLLSAERLLRLLEQEGQLTLEGPRDLPERQRTMMATVAWSVDLLPAEHQRAFRRFGALPGLFPVDAAAAVLSDGPDQRAGGHEALRFVADLLDTSLLRRAATSAVPTCALYYMLDTVRTYAALQLKAAGEEESALEGLARYCAAEAALAEHGLTGPDQVEWVDRVREDLESYRASLAWLLDRGRAVEAAGIATALLFFWVIRGHAAEGLRWYERILAAPSLPPHASGRSHVGAAVMRYAMGDLERASGHATEALELAERSGDALVIAQAEWLMGHVDHAAGRLSVAEQWFLRSAASFRAAAIDWGVGSALSGLAWVALARGEDSETERLVEDARSVLHGEGPWFLALGLHIRSVLAVRRGDAGEVLRLTRESLVRVRAFQDRFAVVYGLIPLAAAAALAGDDLWAARILGGRAAISERAGTTVVDPTIRELHDRTEAAVRGRLGTDRFSRAFAAGGALSIDAILRDVDKAIGTPPGGMEYPPG